MRSIKKLTYLLGMIPLVSMITIPAFACSYNGANPQNKNTLNLDESEKDDNKKGNLDNKILDSLNEIKTIKFSSVKPNRFNFAVRKETFLKTFNPFDYSENYFSVNKNNFKLDIYAFLNKIYKSSNSRLDLSILRENVEFNNNNNISIDIEIQIFNPHNLTKSFVIGTNEYFLTPYASKKITLAALNKKINYDITYNQTENKNFINWFCEDVYFQIDNIENFTLKNLVFNSEKSYALPFYVENIFMENKNYLDEEKFNLNNLTANQVKQDINNHFLLTKEIVLKYITYIYPILEELVKNNPIDVSIKSLSKTITDLLITSEIIDSTLAPFITELLSSEKGVMTIFNNHKESIVNFISTMFQDSDIPIDALKEILNDLSPSMSEDQKQMFLTLITSEFVPKQYQEILLSFVQLIFDDTYIFIFIDKIFNELSNEIQELIPQTQLIKDIFEFLKIMFTKNADGSYDKTLDLLLNNRKIISSLVKNLLFFMGMGDDDMIDQIFENNKNLNHNTLTTLLNSSIIPFTKFLATKDNYEITNQFVKDNENKEIFYYYDKTKQVTYRYKLQFIFKQKFKLELLPIYNILPDNMTLDGTTIPISLILGVDVLPHFFEFGINDSLDMLFYTNNYYLYLTPIKEQNHYKFNYTIPYTIDFTLNMPEGFKSMFKEYSKNVLTFIPTISWKFIESFATSFLVPSYTMSGNLDVTYDNWLNYNYLPSVPSLDLTFKWNDLTETQLKSLSGFIESKDSNSYSIVSKDNKTQVIVGKKPELIQNKKNELEKMLFTLGSGFDKLPNNAKPVISIHPTVDGKIIYGGSTNLGVDVKLMEISIYFPMPNIIDLNNSQIDKDEFVYNNLYKKTLSF